MEVEGGVTETDRHINQKKFIRTSNASIKQYKSGNRSNNTKVAIDDAHCKLVLLVMNGLY